MAERKKRSREGCYVDRDGNRSDAEFHEEMLDNPEADRLFEEIVARQSARREKAEREKKESRPAEK